MNVKFIGVQNGLNVFVVVPDREMPAQDRSMPWHFDGDKAVAVEEVEEDQK